MQPIKDVYKKIYLRQEKAKSAAKLSSNDPIWAKQNIPFAAELYLGHLRYGTFGKNNIDNVHPVMRQNNWKSRNLVLAGNFNLTNVDELHSMLISFGQHPEDYSDTVTMLENMGHYLDEENQGLFDLYKKRGFSNMEISPFIEDNINIENIIKESSRKWDGGYVIAGMIGHGDAFVTRDPSGIRPAFYYHDDEIFVVASERPVIQTVMNVATEKIKEVKPSEAVIVKKDGTIVKKKVKNELERKSCSFERIYFSRGSDEFIYKERKKLGELITPQVLETIDYDIKNSVFSFIPNTAESSFYGMVKSVEDYLIDVKVNEIFSIKNDITKEKLSEILSERPRIEKTAIKDVKLRTFISKDEGRDDLVGHVYDITYGTIRKNKDNLVIIDDSIVRGTTLKQSILKILSRLKPKKIIVVSSSPQIRYPDCYGIDMAKLGDLIAFKAAIELLKKDGKDDIINHVYKKSKEQISKPKEEIQNFVKEIYKPYTPEQISKQITELLITDGLNTDVEIIYQSIENLHIACPNDTGDWYFTGDYPTPGGNKVVNKAFVNYIEGNTSRAY